MCYRLCNELKMFIHLGLYALGKVFSMQGRSFYTRSSLPSIGASKELPLNYLFLLPSKELYTQAITIDICVINYSL